jgi:hypothetical protein
MIRNSSLVRCISSPALRKRCIDSCKIHGDTTYCIWNAVIDFSDTGKQKNKKRKKKKKKKKKWWCKNGTPQSEELIGT